jgi:transcriptional regulator
MYVPEAFAIDGTDEVAALLARAPLACLVTHGPEGLFASHLPFVCDLERGVLVGHLARANPQAGLAGDGQALAVFSGPNAYVSPNWYPGKAEHGRVVPTWNYEAVHIYGRITWRDDPDWLRGNVAALTDRFEAGQPRPWSVEDAPEAFIDQLVGAIIGVELRIERVEAKRKLSQNRSDADRAGVVAGLSQSGEAGDQAIARLMDSKGAEGAL